MCSLEDPKIQEQTCFSEISQGEADDVHYSLKVSEWVYFEKTNTKTSERRNSICTRNILTLKCSVTIC